MAWGDLASNQMPTFTDAQTGGFTLNSGQSSVTSNQCMTKSDALTKYNLSSTAMSAYSSNQLVPKSAWVNAGATYYLASTNAQDVPSITGICSFTISGYSIYTTNSSGVLNVGDVIYLLLEGVYQPLLPDSIYISYMEGSNRVYGVINNSTGTLISKQSCSVIEEITITSCGTNADGSGIVTLYAYASAVVDTNIDVSIQWSGELSTSLSSTVTILSGDTCGSVTIGGAIIGEGYSALVISSVTPTYYGNQTYVLGSVSGGSCTACSA